jgi:AraC family transcriptional regulator
MRALQAELEAGVHFGWLFGETVAQGLAVYLAQRYAAFPPRLTPYRGGLPKKSLHRVLQYVEDQLDENLSLLVMAEVAGISPNYFSELFSRSTGVRPAPIRSSAPDRASQEPATGCSCFDCGSERASGVR